MSGVRTLRPFHRPAPWVALWVAAILGVFWVCLGPPPEIPELPSGADKVEHFLAYFLLAAGAVQLFATRRALLASAGGLVLMGLLIEVLQGALTSNRMADPYDALANTLGVLAGMALVATPARGIWLALDRRLFGRR